MIDKEGDLEARSLFCVKLLKLLVTGYDNCIIMNESKYNATEGENGP